MPFVSKQRAFHLSVADGTNKFAMGLRDHKLDSVSMAIGIMSMFEYKWAGKVYKSACNDTEQQTQLQCFFLSDRLGMLREPRSVA